MGNPGAESIWTELSATLKALRSGSGTSLRKVEERSGIGRGTLSAVENGKAKPSRAVVEWYDRAFGGDGLPVTMYAEARSAHGPPRSPGARAGGDRPPDEHKIRLEARAPAAGELVSAGAEIAGRWRLRNVGASAWVGWTARRIGAPAAPGLLSSAMSLPVPDAVPGAILDLDVDVRVPDGDGSFAAYWQLVHADGEPCTAPGAVLRIVVIASSSAMLAEWPVAVSVG